MANRFLDSFDHYLTSEITLKWTQEFGAAITTVQARTGAQSLFLQTGGAGGVAAVSITIDYQSEWFVGFALFVPTSGSGLSTGGSFYQLLSNGTVLLQAGINADSTLNLSTPNNGGVYASTTFSINAEVWYYIEVQALLTVTTNVQVSATLRCNKISVLTPATRDTGVPATSLFDGATANRHVLTGILGSANGAYFDDVYINDNQTANNAGFWGDVNIFCLFPASDSSPLDFNVFPTTPTTHWDHVNENPPDGDTTYIYDNNPGGGGGAIGDSDNFMMQTLATFTGTVQAVQYLAYARKDDAGIRTFKHLVNGSPYPAGTGGVLGTPEFSLSETYSYYRANFDLDPTTNLPWTVAGFNLRNFGVGIVE